MARLKHFDDSGPAHFVMSRCDDHNCRTTEGVLDKVRKCQYNPVKSGLVRSPEEWEWLSCSLYRGRRKGPSAVDHGAYWTVIVFGSVPTARLRRVGYQY